MISEFSAAIGADCAPIVKGFDHEMRMKADVGPDRYVIITVIVVPIPKVS
jgi:hypothetical protein